MATTQYIDSRERSKSISYDHSKKSISSEEYQSNHYHKTKSNYHNNKDHHNTYYSNSSISGSNSSISSVSGSGTTGSGGINNNSNNNVSRQHNSNNKVYGPGQNHHYFNTRRHKKFTSINSTTGTGNDAYDTSNKENNINSSTASSPSSSSSTYSSSAKSNTNAPITTTTPADTTSPNKSRMKRLSLTVSISTQMYLEKMGKANSSGVDSEDIKKMKNELSDLKKDCKSITRNGKNQMFNLDKVNNTFGEALQEFGNGMLKSTEEGEALRVLGEQVSEFDESMKEGTIGCLGQFLEPLSEFLDSDIKKARELKRKQNLTRIKYEQSQTNLVDVKKKNDPYANKTLQAKSHEEDCRKSYTSITKEFYEKMVENEKTFKLEIRKQIRDYVAMQVEFYREALENWEEFAEEMDEIIPATSDEVKAREDSIRKKLEADDDDEDDEENDDGLLADL